MARVDDGLVALLLEAQGIGLVGPGPVQAHIEHARGFATVLVDRPDGIVLDLGSGAGLPGLVLALEWPESQWIFLDGRARSAEFLVNAVQQLALGHRVTVVAERAEVAAHDPAYRTRLDVVVARSVASPAVVAECAAGFLIEGGSLVVSEPPPSTGTRWDAEGLARLGMGPARIVETMGRFHFSVVQQRLRCPPSYPRRTGVPARRPLF